MDEARSFLRIASITGVVAAALNFVERLQGSTEVVLIGLAWGFAAIRPAALARAAAFVSLLPVAVLLVAIVFQVDVAWILSVVFIAPPALLALAMVLPRPNGIELAGAGVTVAGAVASTLLEDGAVGEAVTFGGLVLLCETARARGREDWQPAPLDAWKRTGDGARIAVLGERIRMWTVLGALGLGFARATGLLKDVTGYIAALGFVAAMFTSLIGLWGMRDSPAGRSWLGAARGVATWGAVGGLIEVLGLLRPLTGGPGYAGLLHRGIAQVVVAPLLAMAFIGLAARAGVDIRARAHSAARWYLAGIVFVLAQILVPRETGVLAITGIGSITCLVVGVVKLVDFSKTVSEALPAGAANDAFGDAPTGDS